MDDKMIKTLTESINELTEENKSLKSIISNAQNDFKEIASKSGVWMCPYCKHAIRVVGNAITDCEIPFGMCKHGFTMFEWRGEKYERGFI